MAPESHTRYSALLTGCVSAGRMKGHFSGEYVRLIDSSVITTQLVPGFVLRVQVASACSEKGRQRLGTAVLVGLKAIDFWLTSAFTSVCILEGR